MNAPKNVTALGVQQPGDHVEVRDRDGQTVSRRSARTGLGSTDVLGTFRL